MANNRTTRMRATKTNQSETARRQMADGRPQLSAFISRQRICFFFFKKKIYSLKKWSRPSVPYRTMSAIRWKKWDKVVDSFNFSVRTTRSYTELSMASLVSSLHWHLDVLFSVGRNLRPPIQSLAVRFLSDDKEDFVEFVLFFSQTI